MKISDPDHTACQCPESLRGPFLWLPPGPQACIHLHVALVPSLVSGPFISASHWEQLPEYRCVSFTFGFPARSPVPDTGCSVNRWKALGLRQPVVDSTGTPSSMPTATSPPYSHSFRPVETLSPWRVALLQLSPDFQLFFPLGHPVYFC